MVRYEPVPLSGRTRVVARIVPGRCAESPVEPADQGSLRGSVCQSIGMAVQPFVPLAEPRLRILRQAEALSDGVVGGEICAPAQRDRIVEFDAVEHRDFVGMQPLAIPGDEEPVQQCRCICAADPRRKLGEVRDQRLDVGGRVFQHTPEMEHLL